MRLLQGVLYIQTRRVVAAAAATDKRKYNREILKKQMDWIGFTLMHVLLAIVCCVCLFITGTREDPKSAIYDYIKFATLSQSFLLLCIVVMMILFSSKDCVLFYLYGFFFQLLGTYYLYRYYVRDGLYYILHLSLLNQRGMQTTLSFFVINTCEKLYNNICKLHYLFNVE